MPVTTYDLPGAVLHSLPDDRFKTSRLTAAVVLPLREETASAYAILPYLLRRSCREYPDFTALQRRLSELYGAYVFADVTPLGDCQVLLLGAGSIDDRYALDGEPVAALCAELLCSMLFDPVLDGGAFPEDAVRQEKRCLTELIESEINEKRLYARRRCVRLLCEGEGYALERYGTVAGVDALTPAGLADAWRQAMREARLFFIHQGSQPLSGGDALAASLEKRLSALPGRSPAAVSTAISGVDGIRESTERMEVNQAKLVLGLRYTGGDLAGDVPALRLMNALLGGSPHSLLFRNVREKLSLCYYCASSYDRLKGVLLIDSGVEEAKAATAREEIMKQLASVADGAFTDEDLDAARLSLVNQYLSLGDMQSSLGFWYVGQCLDDRLVSPEESAAALEAVTRQQVVDAARAMKLGSVYMLAGGGDAS